MAEENESNSSKKRRIIHWNPDAGRETVQQRWTLKRILLWGVGGFFGVLIVLGAVNRVARHVFGVEIFGADPAAAVAANAVPESANATFVSQSKAELAFEQATKALSSVQRMPLDHPMLLQRLMLLEKSLDDGKQFLKAHEWAPAFTTFDALNRDIDVYGRNIKSKQEATQKKNAILVRIKDLEITRTLSPGSLEAALEAAGAANKLLEEGNFLAAKELFDKGYAELAKAEQALAKFVWENLEKGQQALTKGQRAAAKEAFQIVLEKAPGNEVAIQGLKRAETIDRVHALLLQGESLEKQAQYAQAAESYQKAFSLDPQSAAAQAGVARASRLEKETKFGSAMAAAQAAVQRRDWAKVITEAQNALKVYPQKAEVTAMLKSARENEHRDAVQKSLNKAYAFENEHQWAEAYEAYDATLKLEPDHVEAREGYIRSATVIRALLKYKTYVESAQRLAEKAEFQLAIRSFNDAMAAKPSYLVPDETTQRLHAMLMSQNNPVDVTFKSDGKTWVSITNFRAPAQFENATIKIVPGNYEIRGTRRGFQDVLMQLRVRGGSTFPVVNVICQNTSDRG